MNGQALRVWLVDDDASIRWVLDRALKNGGMAPKAFDAAEPALIALKSDSPDVLITDIRMGGHSGLDLLRRAAQAGGRAPESGGVVPPIPELLGRAPAMQQVFRAIGRLSRSSVNVLVTGESGTGKELAARVLHEHSPRAGKAFIAL